MLSRRKPAPADYPIHDLLLERWSSRAFEERDIEPAVVLRLFEAARWTPSSGNEQPWRFVVAPRRDTASFARLLGVLSPGNQSWARHAGLLGVAVAASTVERSGQSNRWAWYDTGQAVAHLTIQATHEGLILHQMAGFDAQRAREACAVPEGFDPVTALAIGYPGDPGSLEESIQKRETTPRTRRALGEILFEGRWGSPFRPMG